MIVDYYRLLSLDEPCKSIYQCDINSSTKSIVDSGRLVLVCINVNKVLSLSLIIESADRSSICQPSKYFLYSKLETNGVLKELPLKQFSNSW